MNVVDKMEESGSKEGDVAAAIVIKDCGQLSHKPNRRAAAGPD